MLSMTITINYKSKKKIKLLGENILNILKSHEIQKKKVSIRIYNNVYYYE